MLSFLRKHQRFFFIIITVVVVISFSFFGTFQTISAAPTSQEKAFIAVDGQKITRKQLADMVSFLSTDVHDRNIFGGPWGYNFLNDGVVRKSFFENDLATILADNYFTYIQGDLQERLQREKGYLTYTQPQVKFLNAEMAWKFFAPGLKNSFDKLMKSDGSNAFEDFQTRVNLFLEQQKFTPDHLRQVLHFQENQYSWVSPDPNLPHQDLSLFRYHNLEDWFGTRFVELVGQFVYNAAIIAEKEGYRVSDEEARADLVRLAEINFQRYKDSLRGTVNNSEQYMIEGMRRLGVTEDEAVSVWKNVLLFRRYFEDVGHGVFESPIAYEAFEAYAGESVDVDLYQLPEAYQFSQYTNLQEFEAYVGCVAPPRSDLLDLPTTFYSVRDVEKNYPSLVQRRYLLEIAEVNKGALEAKVGVRETWDWEIDANNWAKIVQAFPELNLRAAMDREAIHDNLNKLNDEIRRKVDAYVRSQIVDGHPEWLEDALQNAETRTLEIGFRSENPEFPLPGLTKPQVLVEKLESLVQAQESDPLQAKIVGDSLLTFSTNDKVYYRIKMLNRAPQKEVLLFSESVADNTMTKIAEKKLRDHYLTIRETDPATYKFPDGQWIPFKDVEKQVADNYLKDVLSVISAYMSNVEGYAEDDFSPAFLGDFCAAHRFFSHVVKERARMLVQKSSGMEGKEATLREPPVEGANALSQRTTLKDQWALVKKDKTYLRNARGAGVDQNEIFILSVGSWSRVFGPSNGDVSFYKILERRPGQADIRSRLIKGQDVLSQGVQEILMRDVLNRIQEKKGIAFDYLPKQEG